MAKKSNPLVSIIVPTKNEEKNIERCLKSIKAQSYRNLEIIVVDNNSSDRTVEIAKKYTGKIFLKGPERSTQRNFGASKAEGKYLIFLDADMQMQKKVVEECVTAEKKAVILSEAVVGKTYLEKCRALEKECYLGDDLIEAARFFEKELFLRLKGYDRKLIASEDWDLTEKIRKTGAQIGRTKSKVLHFEKEGNIFNVMKKKFYYGVNLPYYFKKNSKLAQGQYNPFRGAFLRNWRKLLVKPHLTLGMFTIKFCEFSAGGVGYLIGVWQTKK